MTQQPVTEQFTLNVITESCEKLINQTQTDLEFFRHEQNQLRAQILGILEDNNSLNTKLEVLKNSTAPPADSRDDATREKITKEALKNVQQQIEYLQAENKELRLLNQASQKTAHNLQNEIQNYRRQIFKPNSLSEVKQKYMTTVKVLENTIKCQKTEIVKQGQVVENLFEQKKILSENIQQLQEALKEKDHQIRNTSNNPTVEKLQVQLTEQITLRNELENSLNLSKRVIEERFEREKNALQKVQEALAIAETAVADKEEAQKREQVVKEECDNLASTIGQVMDEAARKVEQDIDALKKKFSEKEKFLMEKQTKLNEDLLNHKKFNEIVENRCNRFELKYKEVVKENEKLSKDLQCALQTISEIELKFEAHENLLKENKHMQKLAEEREKEIQHYIQTYKQSKEKYKLAMEDVTKKFEKEIYRLQNENASLKAENHVIKTEQTTYSSVE